MLIESCEDVVWGIARCDAGKDDERLGKSEAVVGEWGAGTWE